MSKHVTLSYSGNSRKAIAARKALIYYYELLGELSVDELKLCNDVKAEDKHGQIVDALTKSDAVFIQGICNEMFKHGGIQRGGIAWQMIRDWSVELRNKAGLRSKRKALVKREMY